MVSVPFELHPPGYQNQDISRGPPGLGGGSCRVARETLKTKVGEAVRGWIRILRWWFGQLNYDKTHEDCGPP